MAAVDVEDESLLASIFRDSFPDSWRDNPELAGYLSELSSFGLEKLLREPERLAEEREAVRQQTRELAFSNYHTFIRTARCTGHLHRGFGRVEARVTRLLDRLPPLTERCRAFVEEAELLGASRRLTRLTLSRHTEILEVLEIPQLMDTCVRNAYYEEALELAGYAKRLERRHGGLPVIQGMVREVRQSAQLMLSQLLQQLRGEAQLPACLRVVGYLRRMEVFTEAELRVKFLQTRGAWLQSVLAAVPEDDAYVHVAKTVEACRVHLFDIVTQYRAVFSDDEAPGADGPAPGGEAAVFHGWLVRKVEEFLRTLERGLRRGVGGRLDSLLGQCMYFGLSFSRVGADFRGQLAPVFQRAAAEAFGRAALEAADGFREDMSAYALAELPSAPGGGAPRPPEGPEGPEGPPPPEGLLLFPPLARLLNRLLAALNELRRCLPVGLAEGVARSLGDALSTVSRQMAAFHRAEAAAFSEREKTLFLLFVSAYAEQLLPFIDHGMQRLLSPQGLGLSLGVPPSQLQRLGGPGRLDLAQVLQPLDHLLPRRDPEIHMDPRPSSPPPPGPGSESDRPPPGSPESGLPDSEEPEEPRRDGDLSLD